jgi:hypothetical protein
MAIVKIKAGNTYLVDQKEYFADGYSDLESIASGDRSLGDYAYILSGDDAGSLYIVNGTGVWVKQ